jgi:three-Cys-motif partner protein
MESFSEFIDSYSKPARKTSLCYLELFTGGASYPCNGTDCKLEGTFLRVLKSRTKFKRYGFLARTKAIANDLRSSLPSLDNSADVEISVGNPNHEKSLLQLLNIVPRASSAFAFIDPGGYRNLNWSTLEKLASHGKNWQGEKIELLLVFPLEMGLLRNLLRTDCADSLSRFYGSRQWEDIKRQMKIGKIQTEEIKYKLVEVFKTGLHNLGYHYVEDFKPASPTLNPYYHLIYAGDNDSRLKQMKDAWGNPRFLRCELLYGLKNRKSSLTAKK